MMRTIADIFSALFGIRGAHAQSSRPPSSAVTKPYLVNGVRFSTLQAAFNAATPGSVVFASGTVTADPAILRTSNVTLRGPAKLDARGASAEGKALIVVKAAGFVVEEIEVLNVAVADSNGAFIRMEANGDLTLRHCHVHDGQQGILTNNGLNLAHILLEDCTFERLGSGSGQSHNIYIGQVAELRIIGGRYNDSIVGHCIKSRAARTIIEGAQIHEGRASRAIDLAHGGVVEIVDCDIIQTPETNNSDIISYGIEGKFWPQNTFHFYASNRVTNTRKPPGAVFTFKFEPDVKVIENYGTGTPPPPAPPAASTLTFVPKRNAAGEITNWGELPLNTWAQIDGTRMDQLEPLIRRDFVDYGVEKFRGICDDWGGAAFDSDRAHLLVRNLGHAGTNNNGTYRLNYRTMRWDIVDQPSVITAQEIEETNAFIRNRRKAQLIAAGMSPAAAEAEANKLQWAYKVEQTYNGGDAYKDGKPAGGHSLGRMVWLAQRQRMLISITNYWELEIGRGWRVVGPTQDVVNGGALFEDSKTGRVWHAYMHQDDYWGIHEWDPATARYVSDHDLGLTPRSKYSFYITMAPCLVGREIFVLNIARFSCFAFNLDTKKARTIELDQFPAITRGSTCITHGDQVLVLEDTGKLWRIDPKKATCRLVAAQGNFGARPVNGMYGRARTWNNKLITVPTTYENVRVIRLS